MNNMRSPTLVNEGAYLMQKAMRHERRPIEAVAAAVIATLAYLLCFYTMAFEMRYLSVSRALLVGPLFCLGLSVGLGIFAVKQYQKARPSQGLMLIAVALFAGTSGGTLFGDRAWWRYTVNYYNYQDMAAYVNVDPGEDLGQSYMDAGYVYFKENTYVIRGKAMAFHNGATYCVAPIVRQSLEALPGQADPTGAVTSTGFVPPRSGTIDFWAVGTDCCGTDGTDEPFTCGDAASKFARSGMRVLSNEARNMYLLAVQEWSATTGLPVKHPVFFNWVKDPIHEEKLFYVYAQEEFVVSAFVAAFIALVLCFAVQMVLARFKWRSRGESPVRF